MIDLRIVRLRPLHTSIYLYQQRRTLSAQKASLLQGQKILCRIVRFVLAPQGTLYKVDSHSPGGVVFKGGGHLCF